MNTTGAGCTNTECDAHLANVYLRTWNRRSPSVPTAIQEQRPHDWTEDFAHENGRYINCCNRCAATFVGHKRRVSCKLCSAGSEEAANSDTDRLNWLDAEAKRLLKRDPLGIWPHSRPRVVLAAEEVFNAGGDIRKAIDAARVQGENSQ